MHDHDTDELDHTPAAARRDHAPTLTDSSQSELMEQLRREFPEDGFPVACEVVEFLRESGYMGGRATSEKSAAAYIKRCLKILRYIKDHPNSTAIYAVLYIFDEKQFDDLNRHQNQTEFAKSIGVTKAAVNNAVMDAARYFEIPPRQDQRKPEHCENMSAAIIERLEATGK